MLEHMFDPDLSDTAGAAVRGPVGPPDAALVRSWTTALLGVVRDAGDEERISLIRALEELTCAAAGAQAVVTADFDRSQRQAQADAGMPARRRGRGVAAQVALARRESPHRGQQHLGLAKILTTEMPHTLSALRAGRITEWRATLLARETACLAVEHRAEVDLTLSGDGERAEAMGDAELVAEARTLAYRLDPHSFVERRSRAEAQRRVTLRPAPDVMSQLSALLPVKDGVAVYASLKSYADAAVAGGDARGRGQIMADTLVARVTGATGETSGTGGVQVSVNLVVSDEVLLAGQPGEAYVEGHGPVPAPIARDWVAEAAQSESGVELRRVYARPGTGELVAMDSRARVFRGGLAHLIRVRDRTCRTPWCDAPLRHHDHVVGVAEGGETSERNGQGLCVACNHAKQAPGWAARPRAGPRHSVETTTPTGHRYVATAPPAASRGPTTRWRVDLMRPDLDLDWAA